MEAPYSHESLRDTYISYESQARLRAIELRKDQTLEAILNIIRLHYQLNRNSLEWARREMDRRAEQVTQMVIMFNEWMEKWTPMLDEIRKEREQFKGRVGPIGQD